MSDREKLIAILAEGCKEASTEKGIPHCNDVYCQGNQKYCYGEVADHLIANGVTVQEPARPIEEWGEDYGDVLWWRFPIEEPPYVGSPLDVNWPAYHTHWTPIVCPNCGADMRGE